MIRIDEIYQNLFLPWAQAQQGVGLHWFDPFGSTDIDHIVNLPPIDGTARKRVIFWDQEPLYPEAAQQFFSQYNRIYQGPKVLVTSEWQSQDVENICQSWDLRPAYYFFHAWAALDWYRGYNRTQLQIPFRDRNPSHTFLCLNNIVGGRRQHRLELLAEMTNRHLVDRNLVSFPAVCPHENIPVPELLAKHSIKINPCDLNLPLIADTDENHHSDSCYIRTWALSERTLVQIVTETVYHGNKNHLTEKTFRPVVCQQPFVLVSCQGSLEYLKKYGFQTFGDLWDESYDHCDDRDRITRIGQLLQDLDSLSIAEKQQLHRHLIPKVEHNFQWFYSREFENLLWQELTGMIRHL